MNNIRYFILKMIVKFVHKIEPYTNMKITKETYVDELGAVETYKTVSSKKREYIQQWVYGQDIYMIRRIEDEQENE